MTNGQVDFLSFLEGSADSYTFEQHFEKVLAHCKDNPGNWVSSLPVRAQGEETRFTFKNSSVDFALVKCIRNDDTDKFFINTYDITIGSSSLVDKERKANALLLKKATGFKRDIEVRHHILCLKKHCADVITVNQNAKLYYSNI